MVRTSSVVYCALAAAVAQADVSSSWTSFAWSSSGGATFEKHEVRRDAGQMHERVEKVTSDGGKVVQQVDVAERGGQTYVQVEEVASDGSKKLERLQVAEDSLGKLHGKKDEVRCAGGWCKESMSVLDIAGPGQPLREHPLVASGWRIPSDGQPVYGRPGLRGAVPVQRVHVPCHHGQPTASSGAGGFELKDSMRLTVDDPEAFVADPRSSQAVAAAIAQQLGVDPKYVHVTLSVASGPAPGVGIPVVAPPVATETEGGNSALFQVATFAASFMSTLFLVAACLAPSLRRRRKAAVWERKLRAGSRLEALYDGEWFPGTLSTGQRTSEGYWAVQCDMDIDGQLLYSMDIRPEGGATVAGSQAAPADDLRVGLMPPAVKTPVFAQHGKMDPLAEKTAAQAYVHRLYAREAAVEEARAVHAYTSRIVARALLV